MVRTVLGISGLSLLAAGLFAISVQAQDGHAHPSGAAQAGPTCAPGERRTPILSVADFDGSGLVDGADMKELAARISRRDAAAFFDVDADGDVDEADLLRAAGQIGARSTSMDLELAALFRATERFRDVREAIADGYIPLTQPFAGHGVHWGRPDLGYRFEPLRPMGLLYSIDHRLLGVYFTVIIPPEGPDVMPEGLSGDEPWHTHEDLCLRGVNLERPTYDPSALDFDLCVPQAECRGGPWYHKVYMIHVWLFETNPCGVFGMANTRVTEGAPETTGAELCRDESAHRNHT
jgi:hypothetical protein